MIFLCIRRSRGDGLLNFNQNSDHTVNQHFENEYLKPSASFETTRQFPEAENGSMPNNWFEPMNESRRIKEGDIYSEGEDAQPLLNNDEKQAVRQNKKERSSFDYQVRDPSITDEMA